MQCVLNLLFEHALCNQKFILVYLLLLEHNYVCLRYFDFPNQLSCACLVLNELTTLQIRLGLLSHSNARQIMEGHAATRSKRPLEDFTDEGCKNIPNQSTI